MTQFRTAGLDELRQILDWAAAEGWNPGLGDAAAFYAADPSGFFVATEGDRPVAAISVVNHNDSFAFLGLYIVLPEHRGRGIGYGLWQHALAHAGGRTVGLDGVPEQQQNYAASGFVHAGATTRFVGRLSAAQDADIRSPSPQEITQLINREEAASGSRKDAYLATWFQETPNRRTLVVVKDGQFAGACTLRACPGATKVGPLIADTPAIAERLLRHAAGVFDDEIMIDVPDASKDLTDLCATLGLVPGFQTARMYRGGFQSPQPGVFAVTTLELG